MVRPPNEDNTIRYGREGGEVTLGIRVNPVKIFVEDDGPGIPATERAQVLEPFYRAPQSNGQGCGLGLAIAREIAARHGATLTIGHRAPSGTRAEIAFTQRRLLS